MAVTIWPFHGCEEGTDTRAQLASKLERSVREMGLASCLVCGSGHEALKQSVWFTLSKKDKLARQILTNLQAPERVGAGAGVGASAPGLVVDFLPFPYLGD